MIKSGTDFRDLSTVQVTIGPGGAAAAAIHVAAPVRLSVTAGMPEDPEVAEIVAGFEAKLTADLDKPIGESAVDLDCRFGAIRTRETAIGNFVADCMRQVLPPPTDHHHHHHPPPPLSDGPRWCFVPCQTRSALPFDFPVCAATATCSVSFLRVGLRMRWFRFSMGLGITGRFSCRSGSDHDVRLAGPACLLVPGALQRGSNRCPT